MDNKYIAYCGLDCEKCEARIATINNDDELREVVAKKWSEWNQCDIAPNMINCVGCKIEGQKTYFCDELCEIKKCVENNKYQTCGKCSGFESCNKLQMITSNNQEALNNLKKQ